MSDEEVLRFLAAEAEWDQINPNIRIHDGSLGRSIGAILARVTKMRPEVIFVDHVGMVGRDGGRELDVLSQCIDKLRGLSQGEIVEGYRPWVCATSPLNRKIEESAANRTPQLSDFRGTSRIEYDTDVAVGLKKHRAGHCHCDACKDRTEKDPDLVECAVLKNRFGPAPVTIALEARGATGHIVELQDVPDEPPPGQQQPPPELTQEEMLCE